MRFGSENKSTNAMESDLPLEVLCNILSYLDGCQRLIAGLVCKRWLKASDSLLKDIRLTIKGRPRTLMRTLSRRFPCIAFHSTDIDDDCVDLLNQLGPQLLFLMFTKCQVRSRRKVVNCHRLFSLITYEADICLIFASLPSLQCLQLSFANDLTDEILMAFDQIASSNLSVFRMPSRVVCERLVCKRFYPKDTTHVEHPSEYILSFPALESFMRKRAKTLLKVELPEKITPDAALRLSKMDGLALLRVNFTPCRQCCNIVLEFCQNQPHIIDLNVSCSPYLLDDDVTKICGLLPALEEFTATYCCKLDKCIVSVFRMRHLRVIRLGYCFGITPGMFHEAVSAFASPNLHTLDLSDTKIPDPCIRDLLPRVTRLVNLNLSGCSLYDSTLVTISRHLTRLRVLVLRSCNELSDEGLSGRCEESGVPLCNLAGLVKLDLCACTGFTHREIVEVVRFRHLKSLNLLRCPDIKYYTQTTLKANNPCLTTLLWDDRDCLFSDNINL